MAGQSWEAGHGAREPGRLESLFFWLFSRVHLTRKGGGCPRLRKLSVQDARKRLRRLSVQNARKELRNLGSETEDRRWKMGGGAARQPLLARNRIGVAAGVPPAVEPGILPCGLSAGICTARPGSHPKSGWQDAARYG